VHIDPYVVIGSAVVGLLVGMTGAGGGALMTPMLILLFGIAPSTAISSDLVAAVVMRPVGAAVHLRKGTVNLGLVGWLVVGSVPAAFTGAYLLHLMGQPTPPSTESRSRWERLCSSAPRPWCCASSWTGGRDKRAWGAFAPSRPGRC
jgi:hypothetical protein